MTVNHSATDEDFEGDPRPEAPLRYVMGADVLRLPTNCSICGLREACLPCDLMLAGAGHGKGPVISDRRLRRGESLYRAGDAFACLYTVRSGFFKTVQIVEVGREQVIGFHMAGDMLGADGIGSEVHGCDAIALEDSGVCMIPYSQIESLVRSMQGLRHRLQRAMSDEIVREHNVMLLLGTRSAEERLAAFLLNLSERFAARGYSPAEFILRMTRDEIGSYLGMKGETVCRIFAKFREQGLISVQNKRIRIPDVAGLKHCINRKYDGGTKRITRP